MTIKQMAVFAWTTMSIENGTFVDQMVWAINRLKIRETQEALALKNTSTDFFRIHDSGDFWTIPYYEAWCAICEALPAMSFWAIAGSYLLFKAGIFSSAADIS